MCKKTIFPIFALLALFFFSSWVGAQQPEPPTQQQTRTKNTQENPQKEPSKSLWERTSDDPIALYTALLTAFTAVLAIVSIMQGCLLYRAERISKKVIDLAREEFNATHRPRISLRNFQITNFDKFIENGSGIVFIAQNIGESIGKIIEIRSATIFHHHSERLPTNFSFPNNEAFQVSLKSGEKELFPINGASAPSQNELIMMYCGELVLYCLGILIYEDMAGTRREIGFCRKYFHSETCFEIANSEYEYCY